MFYPRTLYALALSLAVAAATLVLATSATAAAPFHDSQSEGYYRIKVGDFEVTALLDGTSTFDAKWLNADSEVLRPLVDKQMMDVDHIDGAVTGFLVNTGAKLILVDTGAGGHWGGAALGHLLLNLKRSGYRADQVDMVLLTHLHADHMGGITTAKGARAFPNAVIRMSQADSDFWLSEDIAKQAPKEAEEFFALARAGARPYLAANKWRPFTGSGELATGVRPYSIPGHTPGHTGYEFASKDQSLLIWGDLVHAAPVQMERPDIGVVFDVDGPTAIKSREALLGKIADSRQLVAGEHMPFPSMGHVRKSALGYEWVPLPYLSNPEARP